MADRLTVAFILSLIGGVIVLAVGVLVSIALAVLTIYIGGVGAVFGFFGVMCGIVMIVGALMLRSRPQQHVLWGGVIAIFSLLSWFGAAGGLFIGLLLGLVGGVLGIVWRPPVAQSNPNVTVPQATKTCPNCGAKVEPEAQYCPNCGKKLP